MLLYMKEIFTPPPTLRRKALMYHRFWRSGPVSKWVLAIGLVLAAVAPIGSALAATSYRVMYKFQGGADGELPVSNLITDAHGNLYGTTSYGGSNACQDGCGTVFKLALDGTKTSLHAFSSSDGALPLAGLVADSAGNLYGTTARGGTHSCFGGTGCGTIFELPVGGGQIVLHDFAGTDGSYPAGPLIMDGAGNLYGATQYGGSGSCLTSGGYKGCGTVFKLAPDGTHTVLYSFKGGRDGSSPVAGVIADSSGNLYGTTVHGGGHGSVCGRGCGTVFKVAPNGLETLLHAFAGGGDGARPFGGLTADSAGNLYGTTFNGGSTAVCPSDCGTIFKIAANGSETVLHSFCTSAKCSDGSGPLGGLIADAFGNLYGTTEDGGLSDGPCSNGGCGTVFKLAPDGTATVLHAFKSLRKKNSDGTYPQSSLVSWRNHIFGTAMEGGTGCSTFAPQAGCGVVFELTFR